MALFLLFVLVLGIAPAFDFNGLQLDNQTVPPTPNATPGAYLVSVVEQNVVGIDTVWFRLIR